MRICLQISRVQREQYYAALNLPLDVESFLGAVRREMSEALTLLDGSLPKNPHVKILQKRHGWIALSPLNAQPEPVNLSQLKSEILKRWPMTSLLDMLKETDLRTDFSKAFKSATGRESLDPTTLQKRLLLCLYGLGTNTGLKRVSSGTGAESYSDLCAPTFHPQRALPRSDCEGCQCGVSGSPAPYLGRGDNGLRIGLQKVRRLGSKPHDGVARALRR